jgi:hypothetical protein
MYLSVSLCRAEVVGSLILDSYKFIYQSFSLISVQLMFWSVSLHVCVYVCPYIYCNFFLLRRSLLLLYCKMSKKLMLHISFHWKSKELHKFDYIFSLVSTVLITHKGDCHMWVSDCPNGVGHQMTKLLNQPHCQHFRSCVGARRWKTEKEAFNANCCPATWVFISVRLWRKKISTTTGRHTRV